MQRKISAMKFLSENHNHTIIKLNFNTNNILNRNIVTDVGLLMCLAADDPPHSCLLIAETSLVPPIQRRATLLPPEPPETQRVHAHKIDKS
jgi:hypothetical protein